MINLQYLNSVFPLTNGNEFKVLFLISNTLSLKQTNRVRMYREFIADKCNLSEKQVTRITNDLEKNGFIIKDIVSDGKKKKNYYSLNLSIISNLDKNVPFNIIKEDKNVPFTDDDEQMIKNTTNLDKNVPISAPNLDKNVPFNKKEYNEIIINKKERNKKENADDVVDVQAGINSICGANVNANLGQICAIEEGTIVLKSNSEEGDKQENRNITPTSEGINRNITPTSGITDNTPTAEGLNINPDGLCNSNPIEVQPTSNPNSQQTAHKLPLPPQIPLTPPSPYIESLGLSAEDYKPFDGCMRDVAISGTAQQLQTAILSMAKWFEGVETKYQIPHNVLEEVFSQIMEDERRKNGRVWAAYSDII